MNREQLNTIIQKYLDGSASEQEKKMIQAWMLLSEQDDVSLSQQERIDISARLWGRIAPAGAVMYGQPAPRLRQFSRNWLRYAAIWLGVLAVSASGYIFRYRILDAIDPIAQLELQTGPYEIKRLLLPDSSIVTLANNSSLFYPERYRGDSRQVHLKGKAFFNITRNPSRPFIVQSDGMNVKVLGTSFEVNNAEHAQEASVTVVTGKVQVNTKDQEVALLLPDQQVNWHKQKNTITLIRNIDAAGITGWNNSRLVFNETPLAIVLQTISREYGITIETGRKVIQPGANFSGSFTRTEQWKDILEVVCISSGLTWSARDSVVTIKR